MKIKVCSMILFNFLYNNSPVIAQKVEIAKLNTSELNLSDFDFMVEKISLNYAGYDTKTAGGEKAKLNILTETLRKKVATANHQELTAILTEWVSFFKDKHTNIDELAAVVNSGKLDSNPASSVPRLSWREAGVKNKLLALGKTRDPVEGVWRISDKYRIAVLRTGPSADTFSAVVLSTTADGWVPNMVKATLARSKLQNYEVKYRSGNFSEVPLTGKIFADGAALDVGDYGVWRREWPPLKNPDLIDRSYPQDEMFLRRSSAKTVWIRLPDFNPVRAAALNKLIKDNATLLDSSPNLLIDLRNNKGGSDFVYNPLITYLYTKPIYSIGIEMRASKDNIALRKAAAENLKSSPEAADTVSELTAQNELMQKNLGTYIIPDKKAFTIATQDKIRVFPKRIAILIDNAGSTGEQFLLDARQSGKVKLFGKANSAGVLDFANVVSMPSPTGRYNLQWATSRSLRLPEEPVDGNGIAPDIRIPEKITDTVGYASDWLERQVD
jgi:hypothetical protein